LTVTVDHVTTIPDQRSQGRPNAKLTCPAPAQNYNAQNLLGPGQVSDGFGLFDLSQ
jgi:hypothetical protein